LAKPVARMEDWLNTYKTSVIRP